MDFEDYDSMQMISVTEIVEEYYKMVKEMHSSAAKEKQNRESFDGDLLEDDAVRRNEFCLRNHILPISQALIELIILLEWHHEKANPPISETALYNSFLRLERALAKTSAWEILGEENEGPIVSISDFEQNMLEQVVSFYVIDILDESQEEILFFPLQEQPQVNVVVKYRILEKIATVKVTPQKTIYKQKLTEYLQKRIQKEVKEWLDCKLQSLKLDDKRRIMEDMKTLSKVLQDLNNQLLSAAEIKTADQTLFAEAECGFWDMVAEAVDTKLYPVCQKVMEVIDVYHNAHKDFHVNIRDSSVLCHMFYLQLKRLVRLLLAQTKEKSPCGKMKDFNNIFGNAFLHLLYVLKDECHSRISRTMESEQNDSILEEGRILSSSVIVLNCLCTVLDEWKKLEIENEDMQIAFLVKVTDIICDGAKIFSEALDHRAASFNVNSKGSDYVKKVCIVANSIRHVKDFLSELPQMMQWQELLNRINCDPSSEPLKTQILRILDLIWKSMDSNLDGITQKILNIVILRFRVHYEKYLNSWLHGYGGNQNVEKLLNTMNDHLGLVDKYIKESMFQWFLNSLWSSFLHDIKDGFQEGQNADYARTLNVNLLEVRNYFMHLKMEDAPQSKMLHDQVLHMLNLNAKSTVELQLDYYGQLADLLISPVEYLGHLAFQAGYKKIERQTTVDIYVKVQKGQRFPVRKLDIEELSVKIELCPKTIFPSVLPVKTQTVTEDLNNPVFEEMFQFCGLPISVLHVEGAVIQLLVVNQDSSFCAEVVLRLSQVQNMSGLSSIDFLPVYLMPLRKFEKSLPSFQVLEMRSRWDRHAKYFISKRLKITKSQNTFFACIPGKMSMCGLASR